MLEHFTLAKCQLAGAILSGVSAFFLFIATLTPAWQVAEDTDVNRYVQSGLWLYCPGAAQCWYIFSDNLINYYEKVDVCRFLLIGDCRKKLLRTPYFFGWHYAVLILNLCVLSLLAASIFAAFYAYWKPLRRKITTVIFDILIFMANLILIISLLVFVANAEMLESKYLIGVKNTFEKHYGYSFYLACLAMLIATFAMLAAVCMTTFTYFHVLPDNEEEIKEGRASRMAMNGNGYRASQYYQEQPKQQQQPRDSVSYIVDGASTQGFQTPLRSSTPMSPLPQLNVVHGQYIPPARSPAGQFVPTTRHYFSY